MINRYRCSGLIVAFMMMAGAAKATFTLTVSTSGPASSSVIVSSPSGITCGPTCSASFAAGSTVTLTAIVGTTTTFAGWAGPDACATNLRNCKVLMDTAESVTAKFNPNLSVSLSGNGSGTVTDASSTINCSIDNFCNSGAAQIASYSSGTYVTLTASATSNSTFTGWSGACSGTGLCNVTMNNYQAVIATFTLAGAVSVKLRVSIGGTGFGTVTSAPSGINCASTSTVCGANYIVGTSVTLTATPSETSHFAGWANGGCSGTSTCVVVVTSNQQSTGGSQSPAAFFY